MIKAKHYGEYKQVGFIKVRQPDGTYKDIEKKYAEVNTGGYGLVFEKGFTRETEGALPLQIDGIGKPLKDYDIEANIYQSENVSPDTPQEVVGVGERTGNLYKFPYTENIGVTGSGDNRTVANSPYEKSSIIPLLPNTTYYLSGDRSTSADIYGRIALFSEYPVLGSVSTHFYNYNSTSKPGVSFTTDDNEIFAVVYTDGADYQTNYNMQLELSTEATSYEPYGYKVDVECRGKNLVRVADDNYIYYSALNNFTIQEDKLILTNETLVGFKVKVKPNTTYTIQRKRETNVSCDFRIREYSAEPTEWETDFLKQSLNVRVDYASFTSSADTAWVLVVFYITRSAGSLTISNIQLELGIEATEYEPYTPPITTPIYLDSPLYRIGDYSDSRGKTEEVRAVKELVLTGEEAITIDNERQQLVFIINGAGDGIPFCSHYLGVQILTWNELSNYQISFHPTDKRYFRIGDSRFTTADDFKAYLAEQHNNGTPVTVYYVLAEPESKDVEPVEIPTLNGTTVIDVDTEVKPSNVYIKYKSKT